MERTLTLPGADIHIETEGGGVPVVFVHGFGGDFHTWDGLWAALTRGRATLRYDLRGFGRSVEHGDAPFDHGADLVAILDAVEIDRCDLIGVSLGGGIALNVALSHPERVRKLILISPAMVAWEWSDAWRALWRAIVDKARRGEMDAARRLWWEHPLFETTRASPAADTLFRSIMAFPGRQWAERDHHVPMLPDVERLHGLEAPTLLLTGSRDFEDYRLIADLIEASAPHVERVDHQGAGHLLQLELPDDIAARIASFLAG